MDRRMNAPGRLNPFNGGVMNKLFKLGLLFLLIIMLMPGRLTAADTSFQINVNSDDVEGRIDVKLNPFQTPLSFGGGFLYSDDNEEYWLANVNLAVKDEVFTPPLSLGAGFKGIFGRTDFGPFDRDTFAVAFQFLGEFDFRKTNAANVPVSIIAELAYAPDVLSFDDTEKYFDFYTAGFFHINYFAAVFVGYRDIEIDYKAGGRKDTLSDDAFFLGVKLSF
jgi:hypothetical protein